MIATILILYYILNFHIVAVSQILCVNIYNISESTYKHPQKAVTLLIEVFFELTDI